MPEERASSNEVSMQAAEHQVNMEVIALHVRGQIANATDPSITRRLESSVDTNNTSGKCVLILH